MRWNVLSSVTLLWRRTDTTHKTPSDCTPSVLGKTYLRRRSMSDRVVFPIKHEPFLHSQFWGKRSTSSRQKRFVFLKRKQTRALFSEIPPVRKPNPRTFLVTVRSIIMAATCSMIKAAASSRSSIFCSSAAPSSSLNPAAMPPHTHDIAFRARSCRRSAHCGHA